VVRHAHDRRTWTYALGEGDGATRFPYTPRPAGGWGNPVSPSPHPVGGFGRAQPSQEQPYFHCGIVRREPHGRL